MITVATLNKGNFISFSSFLENNENKYYFFNFKLDICPEWSEISSWAMNNFGYIPDAALNPETLSIIVKFEIFSDYLFFKMNFEEEHVS